MANPHDALFKGVDGDPRHASGALQAVLPTRISESINWRSRTLGEETAKETVMTSVEARLTAASREQLQLWSKRVLSAPTLDALFAD